MKIGVWKVLNNVGSPVFQFTEGDIEFDYSHSSFLGFIDLPIEKPKKTVVKVAADDFIVNENGRIHHPDPILYGWEKIPHYVPKNAKNIKCTYEIEE